MLPRGVPAYPPQPGPLQSQPNIPCPGVISESRHLRRNSPTPRACERQRPLADEAIPAPTVRRPLIAVGGGRLCKRSCRRFFVISPVGSGRGRPEPRRTPVESQQPDGTFIVSPRHSPTRAGGARPFGRRGGPTPDVRSRGRVSPSPNGRAGALGYMGPAGPVPSRLAKIDGVPCGFTPRGPRGDPPRRDASTSSRVIPAERTSDLPVASVPGLAAPPPC